MEEAAIGSSRAFHDFRKSAFKLGPVELYRYMPRAEKGGCLGGIGQFVVFEALSVAYRVGRPRPALFVHQRQEQARVKTAA